jgi:hypothetical protein
MKLKITAFLSLLFCSFTLFAQNPYAIKGSVIDTASNSRLGNTTVCVLNAKDSTLVSFTRVSPTGSFAISSLKKGKFILMVTYPDYADYIDRFELDSVKTEHNFGRINMKLKSRLMAEVLVQATRAAVKIKGDTTEYNASSFVIQPNSKVEDLLKQLPGIQVDKDGKITAQGQTVTKVLVDGEEFFGDDPTLVTKNIRGDMVDKVQVYDKTSDQAALTGVDDGVKNKTINIKLKEGAKNGNFGKLDGGIGTDGYYQGQALFNVFKGSQKLSVYGTVGNTGKIGLGWEDGQKYGTSGLEFSDDGGVYFNGGQDELDSFDGNYNGHGLPLARTGGVHYDVKWNADKQTLNTNYKVGYLQVDGVDSSITQQNLPNNIILGGTNAQTYHKSMFRQKFDIAYQKKIDSLSSFKLTTDGTIKHSETHDTYNAVSYRDSLGVDTLINKSYRTINNNVDEQLFNATAFYNKKFMKKGRSFSWSLSEAYSNKQTSGYLYSNIKFYNRYTAKLDSIQIIDEYKPSNVSSNKLNSNITYSEPFGKSWALVLNYGTALNNNSSNQQSFDQSSPGVYNVLNAPLSNNYKYDQVSNQVGGVFSYKAGKTILSFGAKTTAIEYTQTDEYTGIQTSRSFLNFNPQANYQYKFSLRKSLNFNYQGSTTQPTIDQIQPVLVNTNPLYLQLGNAGLKPAFSNRFNLNFNSYKVLTDQYFYLGTNFRFTDNTIVNNTVTDYNTGKTTSQAFNLTNRTPYNFGIYGNFGQKVKKLDMNLGLNLNANGSTSYNYVNNAPNTNNNYTYNLQANISQYKEKKYDWYLNFGPSYSITSSSLQPNVNSNGLGYTGDEGFTIYLPGKLEIGSDGNYEYRPATSSFAETFSKTIINARISKKFLKEDNLKLSISGNDLLNQNVGFDRQVQGSTITQDSYTSIKRFFLFSITFDFSHMGGLKQEDKK